MNQKAAIRIVAGLAAIVLVYAGWSWFSEWSKDPENEAKNDTSGLIAAIELGDKGSKAVCYRIDGTKTESPDLKPGKEDRELSWGSTGTHVFVSSNRETDAFNIYRWNPVNGSFSRRSRGTRSQGAPWFVPDGSVESLRQGLMVAGGAVQELDPKVLNQRQLLPPLMIQTDTEEGGGMASPMSGAFKDIGDSFKEARWGAGKSLVYSVMRREGGEVLAVCSLQPNPTTGMLPPPMPVLAGRKVSIDGAANGAIVALVQGFQWPDPNRVPEQWIKDGKVTTPYNDALFILPPPSASGQASEMAPIVVFPPNDKIFGSEVALSPDGAKVAVVISRRTASEQWTSQGIVIFPAEPGGGAKGGKLVEGQVSSPCWGPDSDSIVYLKIVDKKRVIHVNYATTGKETRVSDPKLDYRSPKFSPQAPGS